MIMKRTKTDEKKLFLFYLTTNNNVYCKVKHETAKKKRFCSMFPKHSLKMSFYIMF